MSSNKEEKLTDEELKKQIEFMKAQTKLLEMSSNPSVLQNMSALKEVITQPVTDYKEALLNPFKEGVYGMASPVLSAAMPIMEDLAGTLGQSLKPTFEALAYLLRQLQPVIDAVTAFVNTGIQGLFEFDPDKMLTNPEQFWEDALLGAAGGAVTGGVLGYYVGGYYGAGVGAVIGGIGGFFFGGFF